MQQVARHCRHPRLSLAAVSSAFEDFARARAAEVRADARARRAALGPELTETVIGWADSLEIMLADHSPERNFSDNRCPVCVDEDATRIEGAVVHQRHPCRTERGQLAPFACYPGWKPEWAPLGPLTGPRGRLAG